MNGISNTDFAKSVYKFMQEVPKGRVVTYGMVAVLCGRPGAARQVGRIAHFGPPNLPWHRLVYASGAMASGFVPGGSDFQKKLLVKEGIGFKNDKVIMNEYIWKLSI
jgi:methylated-DNA-protein-cysteine methyltransferase related protein